MRASLGTETWPSLSSIEPPRMFRSVVFPEPLAPTSPYRSPALSWNEAARNSVRSPNDLARFETEIMAAKVTMRGAKRNRPGDFGDPALRREFQVADLYFFVCVLGRVRRCPASEEKTR